MTIALILTFSAFLMSLLGTRVMILALRKRTVLLDLPNTRSNHRNPTPRGGGIAVVFAMMICLLVADLSYMIVLPVLLLAAISLLDDLIRVPAWVRLLVQILAVSIPLATMNILLFQGMLPLVADHIITGLLWIWFINLFNFMDGIDGISAGEMISIGSGLCLLVIINAQFPNQLAVFSLILAAAGCGFLWWNWHPAKIFLGDVGSVPIGFLIGYLLILATSYGYGYAALILPGYYLADGTITLLRRLWQKKKIWVAHSEHYYQKAVRAGRGHDAVTRYIAGMNILLVFLATLSVLEPELAGFHCLLAYMAICMLLGFFAHTSPHPSDSSNALR